MITLTKAHVDDLIKVQQISRQTFYETFSEMNSEENMKSYLDEGFSEDKLRLELSNQDSDFYLVNLNEQIIGYLKLNWGKAQTEFQDNKTMEIERIYVLKEFQGLKIGQMLFEKALDLAQIKKINSIWLGVWEKNERAINFYSKNGFIAFDSHIFTLGNDLQKDILMRRELI